MLYLYLQTVKQTDFHTACGQALEAVFHIELTLFVGDCLGFAINLEDHHVVPRVSVLDTERIFCVSSALQSGHQPIANHATEEEKMNRNSI